jgi:phosphoribosylcarboxyaminoimidazole (NCAIR) mutase
MFNVVLSESDVQFINEAASVLLPFYKAQMLMNNINGQVEQCKQIQKTATQEGIKVQIAEAVKAAAHMNVSPKSAS